ncbi:MAG: hypothetical protein R6V00_05595 [Candidatus Aminicenantes bacterium]
MKKKLLLAFILFIFSWVFSMNLFSNQPKFSNQCVYGRFIKTRLIPTYQSLVERRRDCVEIRPDCYLKVFEIMDYSEGATILPGSNRFWIDWVQNLM